MLLASLLARPAHSRAIDDLSWAELLDRALRQAGALGPKHGRRVAILARQDADWLASFLGVWLAGGMAVPLSPAYPPAELAWFGDDGVPVFLPKVDGPIVTAKNHPYANDRAQELNPEPPLPYTEFMDTFR